MVIELHHGFFPDSAGFKPIWILKETVMADTLGILVTSDKHLDYVIGLTCAARKKGKSVQAAKKVTSIIDKSFW